MTTPNPQGKAPQPAAGKAPAAAPAKPAATPAQAKSGTSENAAAARKRLADAKPKTRKLNLDRAFIYEGKVYGPGVADVPEGVVADSIEDKMLTLQSKGVSPVAVNEEITSPPMVEQLQTGQQNPAGEDEAIRNDGASPGTRLVPAKNPDGSPADGSEGDQTDTTEGDQK